MSYKSGKKTTKNSGTPFFGESWGKLDLLFPGKSKFDLH